jgi:hypothetical protein
VNADRLRDTVSIDLTVLDTAIRLDCVGRDASLLAETVSAAWERCLHGEVEAPDVVLTIALGAEGARVDLAETDVDLLMHRLSPLVTMRAIDQQAGRLLMLHAAGLADLATGATIGLVAPSGTGKTTAVSLLARDMGYVTDETLGVREDGAIALYAKPLSVIEADNAPVKRQVPPRDLGLLEAPQSCHLDSLMVLDRDGSVDAWVEDVPMLESLAKLSAESSHLAQLEHPLHRMADAIDRAGGLKVLHYADSEQLPGLLKVLSGRD